MKTLSIHSVRNVLAVIIALGIGYVAYTVNPSSVEISKVQAAGSNVTGYAWSGGTDGGSGVDWIIFSGMTNEATPKSYGVNVDTTTGLLSGYAWSGGSDAGPGVGWISFDSSGTDLTGCPSGVCSANVNLITGKVTGWARALVHDASWDGWISLSGMTNEATPKPYGVSVDPTVDPTAGTFSGYAFGDVVGWISFNCATDGSCGSSNYFVQGPSLVSSCTPGSCSGSLVCNTTNGQCIAPSGSCSSSADCGGGQLCNANGLCAYSGGSCSTNADCVNGQVCNASGQCVASTGGSCNTNADCFNGQICNTTTSLCYNKPKTSWWQF